MTQREIAEILQVTPDYIALLEAGERRLHLNRIPRLAERPCHPARRPLRLGPD
jgi:transcriptional regulator with XRE-family HTH domain